MNAQFEEDEPFREMALGCYGYGRWGAPYWFIGPEQGQSRRENDDLRPRLEVNRVAQVVEY
jgi:hypothetical protein